MKHVFLPLLILVMATPLDSKAQKALSPLEQSISSFVDDRKEDAIAYLERVVNINSGTMNFAGVHEVGQVFDTTFQDLGFNTWWVDGAAFERAGHLFARRGTKGPHFLMVGHLDTVFEDDSPFQTFTRVDDQTATGPGVIDMKGGDVVIVEVLRALAHVGVLDDITVTVVLIGDEESSGDPVEVGRESLVNAAKEADIAMAFEPGDGKSETAVIARRGFTGWEVRTSGTRAHSSQVFTEKVGYGAIYEIARVLVGFYETMTGEELLTFNPGAIVGGTELTWDDENEEGTAFGKSNVVAEEALVSGDLRALSLEQRDSAKERMKSVVEQHLPGTGAEIIFRDSYPPMGPTEGNYALLGLLDAASQDLGYGPVAAANPADAGAADISFAAGHVDMAIDGLGILGEGTHTTHETADLSTFPMQIKRVAVTMSRIAASWQK